MNLITDISTGGMKQDSDTPEKSLGEAVMSRELVAVGKVANLDMEDQEKIDQYGEIGGK